MTYHKTLPFLLLLSACSLESHGLLIPDDSSPDSGLEDSGLPDAPERDSSDHEDALGPDALPVFDSDVREDSGAIDASPDVEPDAESDPCGWEVEGSCSPCVGDVGCSCNTPCVVPSFERAAVCPPECHDGCWGVSTFIGGGLVACLRD